MTLTIKNVVETALARVTCDEYPSVLYFKSGVPFYVVEWPKICIFDIKGVNCSEKEIQRWSTYLETIKYIKLCSKLVFPFLSVLTTL
jgi:hypothetical protein